MTVEELDEQQVAFKIDQGKSLFVSLQATHEKEGMATRCGSI